MRFVEREVIEPFDHKYLNEEVAAFREIVPTTENLCIEIYRAPETLFPRRKLERVRIEETGRNSFEYAGRSDRGVAQRLRKRRKGMSEPTEILTDTNRNVETPNETIADLVRAMIVHYWAKIPTAKACAGLPSVLRRR